MSARLVALLLVTMIGGALVAQLLFGGLGLVPSGPRPTRSDIFAGIHVGYNPVCGMAVERDRSERVRHGGHTYHFCCAGCRQMFEADPPRYLEGAEAPVATVHTSLDGRPKHHTISLTDAAVHRHDD